MTGTPRPRKAPNCATRSIRSYQLQIRIVNLPLVAAAAPLLPETLVDFWIVEDVVVMASRADEVFDWAEGWIMVEAIVIAGTIAVLVPAHAATAASARKEILIGAMMIESSIEVKAEYSE
jgi:hypothetical protein